MDQPSSVAFPALALPAWAWPPSRPSAAADAWPRPSRRGRQRKISPRGVTSVTRVRPSAARAAGLGGREAREEVTEGLGCRERRQGGQHHRDLQHIKEGHECEGRGRTGSSTVVGWSYDLGWVESEQIYPTILQDPSKPTLVNAFSIPGLLCFV